MLQSKVSSGADILKKNLENYHNHYANWNYKYVYTLEILLKPSHKTTEPYEALYKEHQIKLIYKGHFISQTV